MDNDTLRIVLVRFSYLWGFFPLRLLGLRCLKVSDLEADEGTPAHCPHTEF